ncbi:MAG: RNA polymerase factor sigma-54 [Alphaproteobacteria bacterium]|nr:RNA polymerase factor sigma-54 [Alphaproteobacteria bacterium]
MSKISQNLDLRQSQQLVMTQQLQQAIKLLQLSNVELAEFVEEELEKNPLLEKAESDAPESSLDEVADDSAKDDIERDFEDANTNDDTNTADFDPGSSMADIGSGGNLKFEEADMAFENRMSKPETLRDHLTEQLFVACGDARDRMIGGLIIDQLDEAGYLRTDPSELTEQLGCSRERIENLLGIMKGFDPAGVFAANLEECLALQLEDRGQLDEPMQTLLQNLKLLADKDYKKLASICGVNETYMRDMIGEIQALNPKPAAEFDHLVVQTAIPDVLMKKLPKNLGGGWRVELNNETLPRVLVNNEYYTEVAQHAIQKKDKEYLANQLSSANWLVRAMDQRAQTILKVAGEIVEQQDAFFNYGIEFLQPLTLKDIAEVIEMHESTVSRVTTNKYIGTPRGIFELKFFFSTALEGADGTTHSSEAVKARIKTMIDSEDPKKILSDDKIVSMLKTEDIDIARRTVAKYREAMHIPSSVQRRKQKKNL